jgi:hypothetical protein
LGPFGVPESIPGLQRQAREIPPGGKEEIMITLVIVISTVIISITVSVGIRIKRK